MQFAFRWMNCLLLREVPLHIVLRLWDTCLSEPEGFEDFHVYVCTAMLLRFSKQLKEMESLVRGPRTVPSVMAQSCCVRGRCGRLLLRAAWVYLSARASLRWLVWYFVRLCLSIVVWLWRGSPACQHLASGCGVVHRSLVLVSTSPVVVHLFVLVKFSYGCGEAHRPFVLVNTSPVLVVRFTVPSTNSPYLVVTLLCVRVCVCVGTATGGGRRVPTKAADEHVGGKGHRATAVAGLHLPVRLSIRAVTSQVTARGRSCCVDTREGSGCGAVAI